MGEPNWIEWAQGYKNGSIEAHKMVDAHRVSDSSRLTWYVAVCGYVLVNSAQFIDRYLPGLSSWEIAVLLLPWAITAIAAIAGHIALVHAATQEDRYYLGLLGSLDVFCFRFASGEGVGDNLLSIINDSAPKLAPARKSMDDAGRLRQRLVQLAQWSLLVTFATSTTCVLFSLTNAADRPSASR